MAWQDIGSDEAFDILRRASQPTNRKTRDIAAEMVARLHHPDPDSAGNSIATQREAPQPGTRQSKAAREGQLGGLPHLEHSPVDHSFWLGIPSGMRTDLMTAAEVRYCFEHAQSVADELRRRSVE
jgi:hypothetical protein